MNANFNKNQNKPLAYSRSKRQNRWRRLVSAVLCAVLISTNMVGTLAAETSMTEIPLVAEENGESSENVFIDAGGLEEADIPPDEAEPPETATSPEETEPPETVVPPEETEPPETIIPPEETEPSVTVIPPEETEPSVTVIPPEETEPSVTVIPPEETEPSETDTETKQVYTLFLTHYFRFTVDGKKRSVQATETVELTDADFVDGVCDLTRFVYDSDLLTVTEAKPLMIGDFNENRQGGARIVYAVKEGWRVVRKGSAAGEGSVLREVFNGLLGDYEFVPENVVRINIKYMYSNTGGLAGIHVANPQTIEAIPVQQNDKTYKVTWNLPTVEGFRIVLNPQVLNVYVKNPPTGNETQAELEAKLENGDFDVDIANHTIYYYQEVSGQDTDIHPTYQNRYSTEYNNAWNAARTLTTDDCIAAAVGDNNNHGANPLVNPRLEVTLTEEQLAAAKNGKELDITVYYRRNATWYTVNHWVPQVLSGLTDFTDKETKTVGGTEYVRLDQETLQGRVGAMTRATARTDGKYEELGAIGFSQKLIENTDTVVDIYYKAADSYRIIFDTDYTYIPRQQVALGAGVDFMNVTVPTRTGYTFDGWRYLKKEATPNANGEYDDSAYENAGTKDAPELTVNDSLIAKAKLQDTGGVLALHLYPKWTPATTQVRVILWTEDLTGEDVYAHAEGGNSSYYDTKYQNYQKEPTPHVPQIGQSDSNYSNAGSFVIDWTTGDSLLKTGTTDTLDDSIISRVNDEFSAVMNAVSNNADEADFYEWAAFEIIHEGSAAGTATTASGDGKTTIYAYFNRKIYTLMFHYYGEENGNSYSVCNNTNGYSNGGADGCAPGGQFNFAYGNGNSFMRADVSSDGEMPVPQTITIKAKYNAPLRDVWPTARAEEVLTNTNNQQTRAMSWATTDGQFREEGLHGPNHQGELTVYGTYTAMSSEIVASKDPSKVHHMVMYWTSKEIGSLSKYRYNHCYEVPGLDIASQGVVPVTLYGNPNELANKLYLVPTENAAFEKYGFTDLMKVSYADGNIQYDTADGNYYAVRAYGGQDGHIKYYALARRVQLLSSNQINKQSPSARQNMTRVNEIADHTTQHNDDDGAWYQGSRVICGSEDNPYDLYFYYDRDWYTITYTVPVNAENSVVSEVTLGTVRLPYGAQVTQEEYGFPLVYTDTNQQKEGEEYKYPWTIAGNPVSVCPDRSENGTAEWKFKGWGLGPAGLNMQWTVNEDIQTEAQSGESFAIESNLRLYAIWEAPTYTVTFHLNGGTVNREQIEVEVSANTRYSASGTIPRPVRNGYVLKGWYPADEDGTVSVDPDPDKAFDFDQNITENKHVAAVWTPVSNETFSYTVYYVAEELSGADADKTYPTVQIADDQIVENGGKPYYVLDKQEHKDQVYVSNMVLNLTAEAKPGYIPEKTIKTLTPEANGSHTVIFYYNPAVTNSHKVRFVEAGTEAGVSPVVVKELTVEAYQTVVTPKSAVAKELVNMGYALVNKGDDGSYQQVNESNGLKWLDQDGKANELRILEGENIPEVVIYLVQPIPYTITYTNAKDSPASASDSLNAVTAAENTPLADADGKNPTRYTRKDTFTVQNPERVYENGQLYKFTYWSLDGGTTVKAGGTQFPTLSIEQGTVGNLTFIANWEPIQDVGSLTVSKTVEGNAGEREREFNFTVTLSDQTITGTFGADQGGGILSRLFGTGVQGMAFNNGVATFSLKNGESRTATNLPAGITYTVTETDADQNGYTTTMTGDKGTIGKDTTATAAFINTKNVDSLMVSNTVAGNAGDRAKSFNFTVKLDNDAITGTYGGMAFENGVATFALKHGESKTATGLPDKMAYTVEETEENQDGYVTTKSGESGTISIVSVAEAQFTNTKNVGNLKVTKKVEGAYGDMEKEFAFTVTLSDRTINGTYGDMTFQGGVATFTLKAGESKTAEKLLTGTTYTVEETEAAGYTPDNKSKEGTITTEEVTADFTNTYALKPLTVTSENLGLSGKKTLKGRKFRDGDQFTFKVEKADNAPVDQPMPSSPNCVIKPESGTSADISFGDFIFVKPGTFTYVVFEEHPQDDKGLPGVSYDETAYRLTVQVEDKKDGNLEISNIKIEKLESSQAENGTELYNKKAFPAEQYCDFTNTYNASANISLTGTKKLTGRDFRKGDSFTFRIEPQDGAPAPVDGNGDPVTQVTLEPESGNETAIGFGTLKFNETHMALESEKTFTYKITEVNGSVPYMTYDVAEREIQVKVTDNGSGTLIAEVEPSSDRLLWNNEWAVGDLTVTKEVIGDYGDKDKEFTFTVTLSDTTINGTYGANPGENILSRLLKNGEPGMTFRDGVAVFALKHGESITATGLPAGITYTVAEAETAGYTAASENGTGIITPDGSTAAFTNTYVFKPLKVSSEALGINGKKTLKGRAFRNGDQFTFKIEKAGNPPEGQPLPDPASCEINPESGTSADISFGEFTFMKPGEYTYVVSENQPQKDECLPGISYDGTAYRLTVQVEDKKDGNLEISNIKIEKLESSQAEKVTVLYNAADSPDRQYCDFTNAYNASASVPLTGTKKLTGRSFKQGDSFTFNITPEDGAPAPVDADGKKVTQVVVEPTGGNETVIDFGTLHFNVEHMNLEAEKIFTYKLTEAEGTAAYMSYDMIPRVIQVKVTDDGLGNMTAGLEPQPDELVWNNVYAPVGSLTVSKIVAGDDGDINRDFNFTVTLKDAEGNLPDGDFGGTAFAAGTAAFTLKHGESKTITGIPAGTEYTVEETEADKDGYTTSAAGAQGIISIDGAAAAFTNTKNKERGSLTVSKLVAGNDVEPQREFHFTVTLGDASINGSFGDMTFENGVASFALKHNESRTAIGLPAGITYKVTEAEADQDGYTTASNSAEGTIEKDKTAAAAFTNTRNWPRDGLTVSKTVTGDAGEKDRAFNFTVKVNDNSINGDIYGVAFNNGVATFALKDGESKTIVRLPAGTTYEVVETEADQEGYTTSAEGTTGTITSGRMLSAVFTNTKNIKRGSLTVSKSVVGDGGDVNRDFNFTVTLKDTDGDLLDGDFGGTAFEDGTAAFTLSHGESKTIAGIPVGTAYEVTETDADADGYTTTSTGEKGTIREEGTTAVFTNEKYIVRGGLTVWNKVTGDGGDVNRNFNFTVTLKDADGKAVSGTFGGMVFADGTAAFTLKDGESKAIRGIPAGTKYTVVETEADKDGYITIQKDATGTITREGSNAFFINNKNIVRGALRVSKTVTGDAGEKNREFHFEVTLKDADGKAVSGTFGETVFDAAGTAVFALKDGGTITVAGIPAGTKYTVVESEADRDGYTTTESGNAGTIEEDKTSEAVFTNQKAGIVISPTPEATETPTPTPEATETPTPTPEATETPTPTPEATETPTPTPEATETPTPTPEATETPTPTPEATETPTPTPEATETPTPTPTPEETPTPTPELKTGNLLVSKTVSGNAGETERDFHFTVSLSDTSLSGIYGDMEFTDGVAVFVLKHGESKTAEGLPVDTEYTAEETEAGQDGYTTLTTGESGMITESGAAAVFLNVKDGDAPAADPKNGNLIVSKIVSGNLGDTSKGFRFTVTLGDTSINGKYGDMAFQDGVAEFILKHGESMRASGLPGGIRYTVSESDNAGYTVTASGESGTIQAGETAAVLFNNYKYGKDDSGDPGNSDIQIPAATPSAPGMPINDAPKTGDETDLAIWLVLLGISGIGMITMAEVFRRKQKRK